MTVWKHHHVVGCYIPPARMSKIEIATTLLVFCPDEVDLILLVYLNVEIAHLDGR